MIVRDVVTATPPDEAVIVAVSLAVTEPAEALKDAAVAPAATVTDAGTVTAALLSETETTVPPVGAALERVTVQVLVALEARVVGLHASEERVMGAVRLMVAVWETPLRVAVTTAD
jgi:hypothetical protein